MSKYIDTFMSAIPEGQRRILQAMLDVQRSSGQISTSDEYKEALALALSKIQTGTNFKPTFTPKRVDESEPTTISSADLNQAFQDIITDLGGLYAQLDATDNTITSHDALRKSDWSRIRDALNKVAEDVVRHRTLMQSTDWQDVKYIDFWTNKVGDPTARAAAIDPQTKKLTLATKAVRRIEQQRGGTASRASVVEVSSIADIGSSKSFWPDNALNANEKSFWAHLMLTDATLTTEWEGTNYSGAVVAYMVQFANAEFINHISLLPYANFPITVIDMWYRDGDTWNQIPGFSALSPTLDWAEFRFERIQANAIKLIILQPNYTHNRYLVPRNTFNRTKLWDQVVDDELLLGVEEEDLTGRQQMEIETNPRFRTYLYALKQIEDRLGESGIVRGVLDDHDNTAKAVEAVVKVLADTNSTNQNILKNVLRKETDAPAVRDEDLIQVDKFEYLIGLRNIRIHDTNYLPVGVYRSPEFAQRAMPYAVAVEVDESRVLLDAPDTGTYYACSAEYEVEISPDRKANIMPWGTTSIADELVVINPKTMTGTLRFTPAGAVTGRVSGQQITSGTHFSVSGRTVSIISGWSPNYIYTFSYTPTGSPTVMDIDSLYNSVALDKPEVFACTDKYGSIDLTYYPYVAYEIVNSDTAWAKEDNDAIWTYRMGAGNVTIDGIAYGPTSGTRLYSPLTVTVNGIRARNITNYRTREHPGFTSDPKIPTGVEYIHVGKRLYMSRPLKDATIEVQYRWIAQYLKLNIYLRAHGFVSNPYTPIISNAKILVRSGL